MTNQERAIDVIDRWTKDGGELNSAVGSPHEIATLLADAGLLMPDLPEPNSDDDVVSHRGVNTVRVYLEDPRLPAYEARDFALRILAAVKLAEEQE